MAATEPSPPAASQGDVSPFKFLDSFSDSPRDHLRFGGREREIRELVPRMVNEAAFVLYGRSGIGKTSLLLAGVFPELRQRGYRPVYARTLVDPIDDVGRVVAREPGSPEWSGTDLKEYLGRAAASGPIVLVLDQFEEFFLRFRDQPAVRAAFVEVVASIAGDNDLDVMVTFSLREDYLAELDDFRRAIPDLLANSYRLHPLTAYGVRQAVIRPLVEAEIEFEEALVSKLVDQMEEFGFDPPVLQIICSELYAEAARRPAGAPLVLTLSHLDTIGGLPGIFNRYFQRVSAALPSQRHLLARMVLDALITRDSTKRAARVSDLLTAAFSAEAAEVEEVLKVLTEQRLLRRQELNGEAWYELIHECLVPNVRVWLDLDPEFSEFRQARTFVRINSEGELWRQNPDALLSTGMLSGLLERYRERFRFGERELELVVRSAVATAAPGTRFWAERIGIDKAADLVRDLARSEKEAARQGAVETAAGLPEAADSLAPFCLDLALCDPTEAVRRVAGLSLARLARESELRELRVRLAERGTRARAKETLGDLVRGGCRLEGFTWSQRWRACEKAIRARGKVGATQGFRAGLVWTGTVGLLLFGLLTALERDQATLGAWLSAIGVMLGVGTAAALLVGPALGWLSAWAAARDAASHAEGRWFLGSLRGPGIKGALAVSALILGSVVGFLTLLFGGVFLVVICLPLLAVIVLLPIGGSVSRVFRPCYWPGTGSRALWLWALVVSAGLPLLVPASAWALISWLSSSAEEWSGLLWKLAIGTSFATCVVTLALARSSEAQPLGVLPACLPDQRRRYRAVALAVLVALLGGFGGLFGPDAIPLFALSEDFDPDVGLTHRASLGPLRPDVHYFWIQNATGNVQVARITALQGKGPPVEPEMEILEETVEGVDLRLGSHSVSQAGEELLLLPGRTLASFTLRGSGRVGSSTAEVTLQSIPVPLAAPGSKLELRSGEPRLARLPFARVKPGEWRVVVAAALQGAPATAKVARLELLWLNPTPAIQRVVSVKPTRIEDDSQTRTAPLHSALGVLDFATSTEWVVKFDENGQFSLALTAAEQLNEDTTKLLQELEGVRLPEVLARLSVLGPEEEFSDELASDPP
jgi:hypothetical protein